MTAYKVTAYVGLALLAALVVVPRAWGQNAADPPKQVLTVIDPNPIASPRAFGMGGAISPVADDLDAAFYNPAGIGGYRHEKSGHDTPWIRKLYFPWLSAGGNQNSAALNKDMRAKGANTDASIANSVLDSHGGQREYARVSAASGLVFGRTMCAPFVDAQAAVTPRGQGTNLLDTTYRNESGAGCGLSITDPQGRVALGYFGYSANRTLTDGPVDSVAFTDISKRSQISKDNTTRSSAIGHNAGAVWRLGTAASPTLALTAKNIGGTTYRGGSGSTIDKQDLTAGFGLQPKVGKSGGFNLVLEAGHLDDPNTSMLKKYRLGTEYLLGGFGSYATFALRAGYNAGGPSAGLMLNLGLIGFEAAVYSVDIAADNNKVIERRGQASAFINVSEF